jgi:lipopolysaccharide biosynthesis glycosyltransferase
LKYGVVVAAFGSNYESIATVTHPLIESYAKRISADFIRLKERKFPNSPVGYEKLQMGELLDAYDRLIWLDTDILIRKDTPSLFDVVPVGTFGAFDEWPYNEEWKQRHISQLNAACVDFGLKPVSPKIYFNSGVMVFDKTHREMFQSPNGPLLDRFQEQSLLNIRLFLLGFKFQDITLKFNHIYKLNRNIDKYNRFDQYIIHYVGLFTSGKFAEEVKNSSHADYLKRENIMFNARFDPTLARK